MGDPDEDLTSAARRSRRWFALCVLVLVGALVAGGAWVHAQVPAAVALQPVSAQKGVSEQTLDARAAIATDRLAAASGRSLASLAEQAAAPKANPADSAAPVVEGAQAATEQYAEKLEELSQAEEAAAADLAMTEEEVAEAEAAREEAAADLIKEEAAAAKEVDAAINAAIAAAQAQSTYDSLAAAGLGTPDLGGTIPEGGSTNTNEVLALVREAFPADQVGNAMAVARCESGHANRVGKANSNGTRDFGVFQINDGGTIQAALRSIGVGYDDISDARAKALDVKLNVRMARAIFDSRGWQPWVCAAKLKIVAGLYQRAPGSMAGKYDEYGRAK